jgi:hyperosmotically inducible protein
MEVEVKLSKIQDASAIALTLLVTFKAAYAQDATAPGVTVSKKEIRKANHKLESDVRRRLIRQDVDTSKISVLARWGVISLLGTVDDGAQIPVAGSAAQSVPGVKSVRNELTVREAGH